MQFLRLPCHIVVLCLLLALGLCAGYAGVQHLRLDSWKWHQEENGTVSAAMPAGEVDPMFVQLDHQRKARTIITRDLIEERLTLLEAAARFLAAGVTWSNLDFLPGSTREERLCRCVINWVRHYFSDDRERGRRLSEQLECELQEHLDTYGIVHLPALGPSRARSEAE